MQLPSHRERIPHTERAAKSACMQPPSAAAGGMHNEKLLPLIKHWELCLFCSLPIPSWKMQPKSRRAVPICSRSLSRHYSIYTRLMCSGKQQKLPGTWIIQPTIPTNPASRFAQLAGRNRSRCFALQTRPAGGACRCMQSTHSLSSEKHTRQLLLK